MITRIQKMIYYVAYQDGRADNKEFETKEEAEKYWKEHYVRDGMPVDSHVIGCWKTL